MALSRTRDDWNPGAAGSVGGRERPVDVIIRMRQSHGCIRYEEAGRAHVNTTESYKSPFHVPVIEVQEASSVKMRY